MKDAVPSLLGAKDTLFLPLKSLATKTTLMDPLLSILPEAHGIDFEDPVALHKMVDFESLCALPEAPLQGTTAGTAKESLISQEIQDHVTSNLAKDRKAFTDTTSCLEGHYVTFYAASETTGFFPYGSGHR